jgi:GNAT superfamily N-acetyltransferase
MSGVRYALSEAETLRCYPVMHQLRTHLASADEFVERVASQRKEGYHLAFLEEDGDVVAVAGFRFLRNLVAGRVLYVDDLVTDSASRSRGAGGRLFDWLVDRAREDGCSTLELDSGVQRFDAHRFYLNRRMIISSHHFRLHVPPSAS